MNSPLISAIRGAICVEHDDPSLIDKAVCKLYEALLKENNLKETAIASVLFTQTSDLKSRNPAAGLRKGGYCKTTPLFCMQELEIEGMLERVIRMLVITNTPLAVTKAVYLDGAEKLRADLMNLEGITPFC